MQTLNQGQGVVPSQAQTCQNMCETGNKKQHVKYQLMTIWSKKIKKKQIKTEKRQER